MNHVNHEKYLARKDSGELVAFTALKRSGLIPAPAPVRIALVGNYAPRRCGIATFTTDIAAQLGIFHPEVKVDVYAMQDDTDPVDHGSVHGEIERADLRSYADAARRMNADAVDVVWLQHEFGIFGGECGEAVLHLVDRIAAPLVVTMHTVLGQPSQMQEAITRRLVARARRLMVMCAHGRDLLISRYGANPDQVVVIEHGAPDHAFRPLRKDRPRTLMTFGLLGPGKGLETAIEALPAIVARHPDTVYRIAGISHPNEVRHNGESYRDSLEALAERLGVSGHIEWINRFLDTDDLIELLGECDIYVTPYPNLQQSTSGTLSYAVALGRAIVSTPYLHAAEILGDIGGMLVEPGSPVAISEAVNRLLDHPDELEALQLRTYHRGRRTVWQEFARNSVSLIRSAVVQPNLAAGGAELVKPGTAAFDVLCDGTGILQHSIAIVPDRRHGYCLDDNARALMLVNRIDWQQDGEELRRASTFASFIQHAWNEDRRIFRNFMNFDRTWCEDEGSEDSNGRALWALGDTAARSRVAALRQWALKSFDTFAVGALDLGSPRAIAFAALGAVGVLSCDPDHALARDMGERCGNLLETLLNAERRPDWAWFETVVGYDNPRLPEALIRCGDALSRPEWIASGLQALRWILDRQTSEQGWFRPVGSDSFGREHEILPFDQQPLEAWAAIDACGAALGVEPAERAWRDHARRAWRWFLGENDRGVVCADLRSGTCQDGINPQGSNINRGAESVLAFQLAYYGYEELAKAGAGSWRTNDAESG